MINVLDDEGCQRSARRYCLQNEPKDRTTENSCSAIRGVTEDALEEKKQNIDKTPFNGLDSNKARFGSLAFPEAEKEDIRQAHG